MKSSNYKVKCLENVFISIIQTYR